MRSPIFFLLIVLFISSCKDDESPTPQQTTLFTLNVDATYKTNESDNWVVIHDSKGNLIDYKSFESGNQYVFTNDKGVSGDLTITTIYYSLAGSGRKAYTLLTYTGVPQGKVQTLKTIVGVTSNAVSTGTYTVSVSNVFSAVDEYGLTSKYNSSGFGSISGNTVSFSGDVYDQPSKYIFHVLTKNELKYKLFDNVEVGKTYNLAYTDLSSYDTDITVTFPTTNDAAAFVLASEDAASREYSLLAHYNPDQHSSIHLGYLNAFPRYRTVVEATYPTYALYYQKFGTPPTVINWPDPTDYTAVTKSVKNFQATAKKPPLWRSSGWYYSSPNAPYDAVNWSVSSAALKHVINELPAEIVTAHPLLAIDKLTYSGTQYFTLGTYQDELDRQYEGGSKSEVSEKVGVYVK